MQQTMIFMVFSRFNHENRRVANFHYHFRNQRIKIHKYTYSEGNRRFMAFGSPPKFLLITVLIIM